VNVENCSEKFDIDAGIHWESFLVGLRIARVIIVDEK
jgi:hypothetical protein